LIEQVEAAPEVEVTTQTDAFMDRPDTADYVPKKTGIDMGTQVRTPTRVCARARSNPVYHTPH